MFKKISVLVLCLALVVGTATAAFAEKALSEKIGLAFTTGGTGSVRMWLTEALALDLGANVGYASDTFAFGLNGNVVFPVMSADMAALYLKPGFGINFASGNNASDINFSFVAVMEAEAFLVKNVVSVGGSAGLGFGINVNTIAGDSTTSFVFGLGTDSAPASLFVRVYI